METIHLLSVDNFKEKAVLSEDINSLIIKKTLQIAQSIRIQSLLGTKLYNKILELVSNNTIGDVGNVNYKTLLDNYIINVIQFEGYYKLLLHLQAQVTDKGPQSRSGEFSVPIEMSGLKLLRAESKNDAEFYGNLLVTFIRDNSNDYPEYCDTTEGINSSKTAFFSGIYFDSNNVKAGNSNGLDYPN
jgi:hypothetical protein